MAPLRGRDQILSSGNSGGNGRDDDDKVKEGVVSTDFKGNVGVTVIVPGGEFCWHFAQLLQDFLA